MTYFRPVPRRPTIDESIFEQAPYSATPTGFITRPLGALPGFAANDSGGYVPAQATSAEDVEGGLKLPSGRRVMDIAIAGAAVASITYYLTGGNHSYASRVALATIAIGILTQ